MVQDVEVCLNISATITYSILDQVLMVMGEVDIGLIPALLPLIIQVIFVDNQVFIVMVTIEADIGLIPANFIHITMVN